MPAVRAVTLISPVDGVSPGLWVMPSVGPNAGQWVGAAVSEWQAPGANTLAQYQTIINAFYQNKLNLPTGQQPIPGFQPPDTWVVGADGKWYPTIVLVAIVLADFTHIQTATISDGTVRQVKV